MLMYFPVINFKKWEKFMYLGLNLKKIMYLGQTWAHSFFFGKLELTFQFSSRKGQTEEVACNRSGFPAKLAASSIFFAPSLLSHHHHHHHLAIG